MVLQKVFCEKLAGWVFASKGAYLKCRYERRTAHYNVLNII